MITTIQNIKQGQRFFLGMWYDYVKAESFGDCLKVSVTNGYDNKQFAIIAKPNDEVRLSKHNS